jgi:uncharacterized membrane protein (UPF0127 family)
VGDAGLEDGVDVGVLLVDQHEVATVEVARTRAQRRRGLLGRQRLEGALWLEPCKQVHTLGMAFAIDVAHLDRSGRVIAATTMRPGRLGALRLRGRTIVEAEAGRFAEWGLAPGTTVSYR